MYKFWVLKVRLRSSDNINGNGGRVFEHDNTVFRFEKSKVMFWPRRNGFNQLLHCRSSEGTKVKTAVPLANGKRAVKPSTGKFSSDDNNNVGGGEDKLLMLHTYYTTLWMNFF